MIGKYNSRSQRSWGKLSGPKRWYNRKSFMWCFPSVIFIEIIKTSLQMWEVYVLKVRVCWIWKDLGSYALSFMAFSMPICGAQLLLTMIVGIEWTYICGVQEGHVN